ncbi:MAG: ATP phosphoribosyltransferase [Clostridia bacterium]|nr:ATP phosphoribosyltransferase [Clostridia bacterium]
MISIALPKGRLGEKVYAMLEAAGYGCKDVLNPGRRLVLYDPETDVRYFWVKPTDVGIYVERGAADVGVAGKDILDEYSPDVFELADLRTGVCRMCVCGKADFVDPVDRPLRIATKFPHIARRFFDSRGRDVDIVKLHGSIELAPVLGLTDVIVDIVETGGTLRENDLTVLETIGDVSARFIANKVSYRFKNAELSEMARSLGGS